MAGKGAADIVFVVDCSLSMVLWNIMCCSKAMIYRQIMFSWYDANATWDLRVDFVAHGIRPGFWARSVYEESTEALVTGLYGEGQGRFFTSDIAVFQSALSELGPSGDEASFVALDFALDLPWRSHSGSHRVVVLLTDEPMETGTYLKQSLALSDSLIEKIHALKVMLFMVTPDSEGFELLSAADKPEWEIVASGSGLVDVDFQNLLGGIATSISKSQSPLGTSASIVPRALFNQDCWH